MKTIDQFIKQYFDTAGKDTVVGYRGDLHFFQNFLCERFEIAQQELENREELSIRKQDISSNVNDDEVSINLRYLFLSCNKNTQVVVYCTNDQS